MGKKDRENPLVPLNGGSCDLWCPGWDSKDLAGRSEQGQARSKAKQTPPDQGSDAEYNPLLEW